MTGRFNKGDVVIGTDFVGGEIAGNFHNLISTARRLHGVTVIVMNGRDKHSNGLERWSVLATRYFVHNPIYGIV